MKTLFMLLLTCLSIASIATAKYSGGTGEPNDPYQIATAADLIALGEDPNDYAKHFILTADIDLDPNLPGRKVFDKAIIAPDTSAVEGDFQGTAFTGVFDGIGHTISHLTVRGGSYVGLFGRLASGVTVRDLGVVDVNVIGARYVGALAGSNAGYVTECYSTGCLTGVGAGGALTTVGGLLGEDVSAGAGQPVGSVVRCHSSAVVRGEGDVGGLVGFNRGNPVSECYATGTVSGKSSVGGLLGQNYADVTQCYSTGPVSGTGQNVGGLVGGHSYGVITDCLATGAVDGNRGVGGLIGYNGGPVAACHSTGAVSGVSDIGGLVGQNYEAVTQCYSTGSVRGGSTAGGLVGYNAYFWPLRGSVTASYALGSVSGETAIGGLVGVNVTDIARSYSVGAVSGKSRVGGLVGSSENALLGLGTATSCFWDTKTSGQASSAGGTGKTTAEMQKVKTFTDAGWDFVGETANGTEDIWWIDEGKGYPRLSRELDEADSSEPYANPDIRDRSLVVQDISQADIFQGVEGECKSGWCEAHRGQTQFEESIPDTLGDPNTPLYFIFVVHTCDDKLLDDPSRFRSGVASIRRIQNLLAEYGGMLSFQTSLRWAEMTQDSNDQTLRWLAAQGCEIGLHLHEEWLIPRYLGLDYQGVEPGLAFAEQQPIDVWMGAFQLIKSQVEVVSGVSPLRLFTGAPMCADRFYVSAKLGFQVTGDYKNPETRTTDERLAVLNPWRPASSSDATEIATYDRNGPLVFIPSGVRPAHCQDSGGIPTPFNYASMDYITMLLRVNLSCVSPGKINVFSVVFHPWDFEEGDFALWKTWLDSVMQPLLHTHRVQLSTVGAVADMYKTWELAAVPK